MRTKDPGLSWGDGHVLKLDVVMAHSAVTVLNTPIAHSKCTDCMVCELHITKAVLKEHLLPGQTGACGRPAVESERGQQARQDLAGGPSAGLSSVGATEGRPCRPLQAPSRQRALVWPCVTFDPETPLGAPPPWGLERTRQTQLVQAHSHGPVSRWR